MKRIRDFAGGALAICAMCLVSARVGAGAGDAPYVSATPMTTPRLFGENAISTPDDEFGGQFSPDGRTLWFSRCRARRNLSDRERLRPRRQPRRLRSHVSYRRNGVWQPLQNLWPGVNSAARDYTARVTPDGKYLIFSSERGVPTDARRRPWTYREFTSAIRGVRNGPGNLYQIDLTAALPGLREP